MLNGDVIITTLSKEPLIEQSKKTVGVQFVKVNVIMILIILLITQKIEEASVYQKNIKTLNNH
tara:strand:- start:711 stop:899 length:189 start_codon:yes stop_codon:yes gene_type:complete